MKTKLLYLWKRSTMVFLLSCLTMCSWAAQEVITYDKTTKTLTLTANGDSTRIQYGAYKDVVLDFDASAEVEIVIIGKGITGIGAYAFRNCKALAPLKIIF